MTRLHSALAIGAALLAVAAGIVDDPPPRSISAPELAARIMRGDPDLRVFDLRSVAAFQQFHIPSAHRVAPDDFHFAPLAPNSSIVLYADDRATVLEALRVIRGRPHRDARVLKEGIFEWLGRVHEPRLAADATPAERVEFERAAEMSRFFGGVPREGVPREEVPQGYWTGAVRTEALLAAAATQAVATIRRRGC